MSRRIPFGAPILTAARMREAEERVIHGGVAVDELMERAGLAIAREVRRLAAGRAILIAAGPGNNGGDAHLAARHLAAWGLDVAVAAVGSSREGAAGRAASGWTGASLSLGEAQGRAVLVDGLIGTGASRPLGADLAARFAAQQARAELTIAIDLPSGLSADAVADGASARADVTIALGALKPGHVVGEAAGACGHVLLADIGVPVESDAMTIAPPTLNRLPDQTQKFSRGMVAVAGGAMAGASLLAATAAMHGGAGYVMLAERSPGGELPHALVRRHAADARTLTTWLDDERIGAVVVGPGLGRDAKARATLDAVLASRRNLVIDADALSLLGREIGSIGGGGRHVFLTPHGGEFVRLFGQGSGNKIDRTLAAASQSGAVVVHKGADTVIATPGGKVVVAASATPWLSTAGTGDVLAGLLAARHAGAQRWPLVAASEAVWLHAAAGALAGQGFTADELVRQLPAALASAPWT